MAALLVDFLPVLVFFAAFKLWDLMVATAALIVVTGVLVAVTWVRKREINRMQVVIALLVLVFGGITLLLNDEMWIKWKPTAVYWLFAAVFAGTHWIGDKPLIRRLFESKMALPAVVWSRLNMAWMGFFAAVGALNLWVVYTFTTDGWVNFKLIAAVGLPVLFALAQGLYIARHVQEDDDGSPAS